MSISYNELAIISGMTERELTQEYDYITSRTSNGTEIGLNEDGQDRLNAVLYEMESRNLEHP